MLRTLMQFQERARLRDAVKAKKARRMVFGLREVMRGIRTGKIQFVVIAPDIERSPALDEEIAEIRCFAWRSVIIGGLELVVGGRKPRAVGRH